MPHSVGRPLPVLLARSTQHAAVALLRARAAAAASEAPPPLPAAAAAADAPAVRGKQRLDALALARFPQHSRTLLQSWIAQGKLLVDGVPQTKAGFPVAASAALRLTADPPRFVCRGGLKLEAALQRWSVDVGGAVCLDAGLSTGGFTDCLLQRGAARVYGVDVGYGQVHERLRSDPRLVILERTNLRSLDALPEPVDVATLDLSFISVLKVLPAVARLLRPGGTLVVLVKPQFEALRGQVGSGGVVRDPAVHADVLARVQAGVAALGFELREGGPVESPLRGAKEGNVEFLLAATRAQ